MEAIFFVFQAILKYLTDCSISPILSNTHSNDNNQVNPLIPLSDIYPFMDMP
jgi:hypothetical protein